MRNPLVLCQSSFITPENDGIRYFGSSKINPKSSLSSFSHFRSRQVKAAVNIPIKYKSGAIIGLSGKKVPPSNAKSGSFAEHGTNGIISMVFCLWVRLSTVLAAITAGTLHPDPIIIGINAFPDSPSPLKILSVITAARAMYPLPSRSAKIKYNTVTCGKNASTAPTPFIIPSQIREIKAPEKLRERISLVFSARRLNPSSTYL